MQLPSFRYHPYPLDTGSIESSDAECQCCGKVTGYIYKGPIFSQQDLSEICPWCIASGEAHEKFDAEFTDYDGIGDYGSWETVPVGVRDEVAYRTPGFSGWQQERWWTHCGDAALFLGAAGKKEVLAHGAELQQSLKREAGLSDEHWLTYVDALSKKGSPTAYVFKCRHCGALGGYSDCN